MKVKWTTLRFSLLVLLLSACAKPPVMVETVLVLNATGETVTDVTVLHEPTKKFGAANAILPGKALEIGLSSGGQPLMAKQALVHWRDAGGQERTFVLDIPYDKVIAEGQRLARLTYVIQPSGQVSVELKE